MRTCVLLISLALCACSSRQTCLPARATPPGDCPSGVFADATVTDPTCFSTNGVPLCRDPTDLCLVCSGPDFPDGCRVHTSGNNYECVHACGDC